MGKTVLGSHYAARCVAKGKRVLFTVHRDFLVDQTVLAFANAGLACGVVAAGRPQNYTMPAQVASIDTLRNRLDEVGAFDLMIVDECHHSLSKTWSNTIKYFTDRGTKVLGLTATPWRMNGAPLKSVFGAMVKGPTVRWLIDNKYLSDYRAFAPSTLDMSGVQTVAGDFAQDQTAALMDRPSITGDAVSTYQSNIPGARALAFCVSVEHSQNVSAQFVAAGIRAKHLDGTTPRAERLETIAAFNAGELDILTSVNIFSEGLNSPAVDAIILLRPTKSLVLHLQQLGRGLRTAPGKDRVTILDHAGNILRLGFPDDDFEWTLEGGVTKKPKPKVPPIRTCPECFRCMPISAKHCPECGIVFGVQSREVDHHDGELVELRARRAAAVRKHEEWGLKTLEDWKRIARERNYKEGWAFYRWRARVKRA